MEKSTRNIIGGKVKCAGFHYEDAVCINWLHLYLQVVYWIVDASPEDFDSAGDEDLETCDSFQLQVCMV